MVEILIHDLFWMCCITQKKYEMCSAFCWIGAAHKNSTVFLKSTGKSETMQDHLPLLPLFYWIWQHLSKVQLIHICTKCTSLISWIMEIYVWTKKEIFFYTYAIYSKFSLPTSDPFFCLVSFLYSSPPYPALMQFRYGGTLYNKIVPKLKTFFLVLLYHSRYTMCALMARPVEYFPHHPDWRRNILVLFARQKNDDSKTSNLHHL